VTDAARDLAQASEQDYATSIGARLVMWSVAWNIFKAHPVVGTGAGTFASELRRGMESGTIPRIQEAFKHAHSDVLNFMATGGLIGMLAYLGVIGGPLFFFARALRQADGDVHRRLYAALGVLVTVSFFCFGLFNTLLILRFDSALYALLVCALAAQLLPAPEESAFSAPAKTGNPNP
jgi:O-antigen ligase